MMHNFHKHIICHNCNKPFWGHGSAKYCMSCRAIVIATTNSKSNGRRVKKRREEKDKLTPS